MLLLLPLQEGEGGDPLKMLLLVVLFQNSFTCINVYKAAAEAAADCSKKIPL